MKRSRARLPASGRKSSGKARTPPIAIVGIGCVLPGGCEGPDAFWQALIEGRDLVVPVPPDRWNAAAHYSEDPSIPGKSITRWGGFLTDVRSFDAAFFGISPREAVLMDPQQRLLLQVSWEALEDAGIASERVAGSPTGVFIGISHSDYHAIQKLGPTAIDVHTSTGGALSIAANRISHRFDLRGPSVAVDTACSSALVAFDAACHAIWTGECSLALAGGVNVILTPDVTISFSRAAMLSPDGRSKAFDARANGYVRGEGAGVVVLKPLRDAKADGDRVYAVVRSTVVNQDGHTSTITVPSQTAQEEMLREACRRAGVDPARVDYVEAHGTGTPVGDPIEAAAIGRVFGQARRDRQPCLLGSVKTNIGHLESAAGIASIIKAALCLRQGTIPPNLHFLAPNPNIPFEELNVAVPTEPRPWPGRARPRYAVVNSFGFGGTNACTLLEAAPDDSTVGRDPGTESAPLLVPLSAASPTKLAALAGRLAAHLENARDDFGEVAAALAHRRSHLDHRLAVIARSRTDLAAKLAAFVRGETAAAHVVGRAAEATPLAFVFTGQGAQWWAMGRGLLEEDRVFRDVVEACDVVFHKLSGWSLLEALLADEVASRMNETAVAQPATFALQAGLVARWRAWGIEPAAAVGHSIGEIAAAYCCGALSLEQAVTVVYHRSRLQERSRGRGGMAAIGETPERARELLAGFEERLEIAAVNGPSLVTVAGDREALDELLARLKTSGSTAFRQIVKVDYAFHSRQMDPFEPELIDSLRDLPPGRPKLAMISTVTGNPVDDRGLDAAYWWQNMRRPVLFQGAIGHLIKAGYGAFVEIGPHPALTGPILSCLEEHGRSGFALPSLKRSVDDRESLLRTLGELHVRGMRIDWAAIVPRGRFVSLPTSPWEKREHWADTEEARAARFDGPAHPLLGNRLSSVQPVWQSEISRRLFPFLADHRVDDVVVFPAAGYVEMMLAAARECLGDGPWEAEEITFHEALLLGEEESALVQTVVDAERSSVRIASRMRDRGTEWTLRATARIRARHMRAPTIESWRDVEIPPERIGGARFYRHLAQEGHQFGPAFRGVETLWRAERRALGRIDMPAALPNGAAAHLFHPSMLDSCFQVIRGFRGFGPAETDANAVVLPIGIARFRCLQTPKGALFSQARQLTSEATRVRADIAVFDEGGTPVATIEGFECRRYPRASRRERRDCEFYREQWIQQQRDTAKGAGPGTWLIIADAPAIGPLLAAALEDAGQTCILASKADRYRRIGRRRFEFRAGASRDLDRILNAATKSKTPPTGIVHLIGRDRAHGSSAAAAQGVTLDAFAVIRRLVERSGPNPPRLWICSLDAWHPEGSEAEFDDALVAAPLSGLCRVTRTEHPQLRCTLLEIGRGVPVIELASELLTASDESEVRLRAAGRFVNRIERTRSDELRPAFIADDGQASAVPFRLHLQAPGAFDGMMLQEMERPEPQEGEVLIEVRAAGLNFRDVMAAGGLLPGGAEDGEAWKALGLECAGVVAAIGPGVTGFAIGNEVVAVVRGCFASQVRASASLVFPKPSALSFAEAAAIPTAFLTAWYALVEQARIRAGERVLVTAGTGGVGLAAIQIAGLMGCEVLASAGSPEKREYLRRLGIRHAVDSRSLDFADDVLAATGGKGVDVVLNSLPGAFIEKGVAVLAPFGRFIEIGKRDIYNDTPIGLRALRNNASFLVVDLGRMAQQRTELLRDCMRRVMAEIGAGRLRPPPVEARPVSSAAEAFRHMAQARHIGKIVLTFDGPGFAIAMRAGRSLVLRDDATYLVTGGLSGFGLATARWLAERGARNLVLVSRSGGSSEEAARGVEALRDDGVEVRVECVDVTDAAAVGALVASIEPSRPLRGIVHAAMVLDDGFITQLDGARLARVLGPKIMGAWNLHEATRDRDLDFFVLYSSISALTGAAGQANYAAANRFLDALAEHRRRRGLVGLSIAWGAIADTGYLTRREDVSRYLESAGITPIAAGEALDTLGLLLCRQTSSLAYARVDWARIAAANPSFGASPRCRHLTAADAPTEAGGGRVRTELLAAASEARPAILTGYLRQKVGDVLRIEPESVDPGRPLAEFGLDSLTSFELKNKIEAELGMTLPVAKFLQRPSVATLTVAFAERLEASAAEDATRAGEEDPARDEHSLSHGQEALWFLHQLAPESAAYHLVYCARMTPAPDVAALQSAFRAVVARHASLRSCFPDEGGVPTMRLLDPAAFAIEEHDVRALDERSLRLTLTFHADAPFDMACGPLTRLLVFRRRGNTAVLMLKLHHLVVDAWSLSVVLEEMLALYFGESAQSELKLPPQRRSYADYVRWSRASAAGQPGQAELAYWRRKLANLPPPIDLPLDHPRPPTPGGRGAAVGFRIGDATVAGLKSLAAGEGATLYATLLAAYQVLLYRLTGQPDIPIGTPAFGRTRPEFERVVGYIVNPVVIRSPLEEGMTFRELMQRTDETVREALEHQDYPFPLLVAELQPERDVSRSPLFQVAFAMERSMTVDLQGFAVTLLNVDGLTLQLQGHEFETVGIERHRGQFDLAFTVEEYQGSLYGVVDYRPDLLEATTARRYADWYAEVLATVSETPEIVVDRIRVGRPSSAPRPSWRHDAAPDVVTGFLQSARALLTKPAIIDEHGSLTYAEAATRAAALAAILARHGIGPGKLVGLALPRSGDLSVALVGTLMTGGGFLPLDPSYPAARLAVMIEDAKPTLLLSERRTAQRLPSCDVPILLLDAMTPDGTADASSTAFASESPAYVIYTSGSTGRPAGVEVPRRALANFMGAMRDLDIVRPTDRLLAVTTLSFDISLLELLLPLTLGATSVIASEEMARDGRLLAHCLKAERITVMQATPATWRMLADAGWTGSASFTALSGGERLPADLATLLLERPGRLWNLYGPTETTIWSTAALVQHGREASIGRPIANTICVVQDRLGHPVPVGMAGQLLIGGAGLAAGYRNRPDLTASRFVEIGGERFFRTGDMVREEQDGTFTFLGRRDHQLKLRGFRIEPDEIESYLRRYPDVAEAAATVLGGSLADRVLAGVLVPREGRPVDPQTVEAWLATQLPGHMVPSRWVVVAALPLTPSGKLDRAALPGLVADAPIRGLAAAPRNREEAILAAIAGDLLGHDSVGVEDNLFELGATSLLIVRLIARAGEALGVDLAVADAVRGTTIAALAKRVSELRELRSNAADPSGEAFVGAPTVLDWRPLALRRAAGEIGPIDAAALTYLPDELAQHIGIPRRRIASEWLEDRPHWLAVEETPLGRIALIAAPLFGSDLFASSDRSISVLRRGLDLAARLGARCVSLTGLIPAATDFGRRLSTEGAGPWLTTGHATTAAAMILSIDHLLEQTGRRLEREEVAFLGLGSIGQTTLRLMLDKLGHPASLLLCDLPAKRTALEKLSQELRRSLGFTGRITTTVSSRMAPDAVYRATLLVGATSAPDVVDVDRLAPGALVVDDSFPPCMSLKAVSARIEARGDILYTAGGYLRAPSRIARMMALPPAAARFLTSGELRSALLRARPEELTGCILSGLLSAMRADLPPLLGPVELDACRAHLSALREGGFVAASVGAETFAASPTAITAFRRRHGALTAA